MKIVRIFSAIIFLFIVVVLFFSSSCNDTQEEKIENTADTIGSKIERGVDDLQEGFEDLKDDVFVSNILEDNDRLINLLEDGKTKGTSITLDIDSMMNKHLMLQQQFKSYAEQHGINYRVNNRIRDLDKMDRGIDWDREWREELYDLHNDLLRKCERKRGRANDSELESLVSNTLPILRNHLNMME